MGKKRTLSESLKALADKLGKHPDACECEDDFFDEIRAETPVKQASDNTPKIFTEAADDDVATELADVLEKALRQVKDKGKGKDTDKDDKEQDNLDMSKVTPRNEEAEDQANEDAGGDEEGDGISVLMPDSDEQMFHGSDEDTGGAGGVPFTCSALPVQIVATDCNGCMYNKEQQEGKVNCQFPQAANQAGFNPQDKYSENQNQNATAKRILMGRKSAIGQETQAIDVCTSCGHTEPHIEGQPANETPCPECGGMMQSKTAKRSEHRRELMASEFDVNGYIADRMQLRIALSKLAVDTELSPAQLQKEKKRLKDEFEAKHPVEFPELGEPRKKPKGEGSEVHIDRKEMVAQYPWLARALPMFRNSRALLNALSKIISKFQGVINAEIDKVLNLEEVADVIDNGQMLSIDGVTVSTQMWGILENPRIGLSDFQSYFADKYADSLLAGAEDAADAAEKGWEGILAVMHEIVKGNPKKQMIFKRFLETTGRPTQLLKMLPEVIEFIEGLFQTGVVPEEGEEEAFEATEPVTMPTFTEEELEKSLKASLKIDAGLWDSIKSIYSGWVASMQEIGSRIFNSQKEMDRMKNDLEKFEATASRRTSRKRLVAKDINENVIKAGDWVEVVSENPSVKSMNGEEITGKKARVVRIDSGTKQIVEDGEQKLGEFHALYVIGNNRAWHGKVYADEVKKINDATGPAERKPVTTNRRAYAQAPSYAPTVTSPAGGQQGVNQMVEKKSDDIVKAIRQKVDQKLQQQSRKEARLRRKGDSYVDHHDSETTRINSEQGPAETAREAEYARRKKEWSYTKWAKEHGREPTRREAEELLTKEPADKGKPPYETQKENPIPTTTSTSPLDKWQKVTGEKQKALEAKLERELHKALAEEFLKTRDQAPKSQPKETLKVNPIVQTNSTDPLTTPDKKWQKVKAAVMAELKKELADEDIEKLDKAEDLFDKAEDKADKAEDKVDKAEDKEDKKEDKEEKKEDKKDKKETDIEKAVDKYLDEHLEEMVEEVIEGEEGEGEGELEDKDFDFDVETGPAGEPMFMNEDEGFGGDIAEEPIEVPEKSKKDKEASEKEKVMAAISLVGLMDRAGAGSDMEVGEAVQEIVDAHSMAEIQSKTEAFRSVVEAQERDRSEEAERSEKTSRRRPDRIAIPGRANSGMATVARIEASIVDDSDNDSMEDAENSLEFMFLGDEYLPQ